MKAIIAGILQRSLADKMKTLLVIAALIASGMVPRRAAVGERPPPTTGTVAPVPSIIATSPDRVNVLRVASGEVGTRERTGNNDGPVEKYLNAVGAAKGAPYCAAFVAWVGNKALGNRSPFPMSAWSPDMVKGGTSKIESARPGDTFGIYFPAKGRVAHTGFIERREGNFLVTIEANTSASAASGSAADREGEGVYRKRRHVQTVRAVKSWLP